jgi:hypothetical protein
MKFLQSGSIIRKDKLPYFYHTTILQCRCGNLNQPLDIYYFEQGLIQWLIGTATLVL